MQTTRDLLSAIHFLSSEILTKEGFLYFQSLLEVIDARKAQGRDFSDDVLTIKLMQTLMDASPWCLHPDYGCVEKSKLIVNLASVSG